MITMLRASRVVVRVAARVRAASTISIKDADDLIAASAAAKNVTVFYKSYCNVCKDVVERLEDADVPLKEIALDHFDNGNEVRDALKARTSQDHVPFVYVAGRFVPSVEAIPGLKAAGGKPAPLKAVLEAAGVPCKGYFRA